MRKPNQFSKEKIKSPQPKAEEVQANPDLNEDACEFSDEECIEIKVEEKNRIAVFFANWIESTLLTPGLPNCYLHSWKIRQVVSEQSDIERLISLNAPIKVYVEDGSYRCAKG